MIYYDIQNNEMSIIENYYDLKNIEIEENIFII